MRKTLGFTLVEIMITMVILVTLAAMAIPAVLRARHNANESVSVNALRRIQTACADYMMAQNPPSYPPSLDILDDTTPIYLDSLLAGGTKHGYVFTYSRINANEFTCTATPVAPGVTGTREFTVDESGVITSDGTPIE